MQAGFQYLWFVSDENNQDIKQAQYLIKVNFLIGGANLIVSKQCCP